MKQLENSRMKKKLQAQGSRSEMCLSPETESLRKEQAMLADKVRESAKQKMSIQSQNFQKKLNSITKKIDDEFTA